MAASDLARKLGLQPGQVIGLVDALPESADLLRASSPPGVTFVEKPGEARCDLLFFWPRQLSGLIEHFSDLQFDILPNGAIWVVIPKKKYAQELGIDFTWEQMQAAGLQTDLVDNKVATFSEQEYATRFVIRKELRGKYPVTGNS
ncbi:MAG TPA: hypothetical protein VI776_03295 [Anaerolineales bacterium]|nr:hypothetical protein [Anaerolineales bacterium]